MAYSDSKDGDVRESYDYEYDKNGKITKKTTASAYLHDDDENALKEKVATYTYDVNGRLTIDSI